PRRHPQVRQHRLRAAADRRVRRRVCSLSAPQGCRASAAGAIAGGAVMTPKAFVYLAIAAVLSVLFAIVSYASNNQWSSGKAAGAKLSPALVSEASQIASVEIKQGNEATVLERKGGAWTLKSRDGYPADPVKVRTLLVGLAEADLVEGKTRRADRYGV